MQRQLAFIRIFHGWTREERERESEEEKRRENKEKMDGSDRVSLTNRVRIYEGPAEFVFDFSCVFVSEAQVCREGPK